MLVSPEFLDSLPLHRIIPVVCDWDEILLPDHKYDDVVMFFDTVPVVRLREFYQKIGRALNAGGSFSLLLSQGPCDGESLAEHHRACKEAGFFAPVLLPESYGLVVLGRAYTRGDL